MELLMKIIVSGVNINGKFVYPSKDELLNYLVGHMPNPDNLSEKERYLQFDTFLSKLKHWK